MPVKRKLNRQWRERSALRNFSVVVVQPKSLRENRVLRQSIAADVPARAAFRSGHRVSRTCAAAGSDVRWNRVTVAAGDTDARRIVGWVVG